MIVPFKHQHAAHCESGAVSSLLRHHGVDISEAMAFGLTSALAFAYLPFIKISGLPLISYRMPPKAILKGVRRRLGVRMRYETFRNPAAGTARLDELLAQGQPVGLQTSVYWLPYFPPDMRFHFNAHNLIVYGKEGDEYLISDPVGETPVRAPAADLQKARFARGVLAPHGLLYYPTHIRPPKDLRPAIVAAIRRTARVMLHTPLPLIGIRGMRMLARRIGALPQARDPEHTALFVGHVVRMQEEIGTGGGGFRFLYASFLQEAAQRANDQTLADAANDMTAAGDHWREFALSAARMCKGRLAMDCAQLKQMVLQGAERERVLFQRLAKVSA
jgi:hypothetical protein